jgi:hypothetical protein
MTPRATFLIHLAQSSLNRLVGLPNRAIDAAEDLLHLASGLVDSLLQAPV